MLALRIEEQMCGLCRKEVPGAVAWQYPTTSRSARLWKKIVAPSAPTAADREEHIASGHACVQESDCAGKIFFVFFSFSPDLRLCLNYHFYCRTTLFSVAPTATFGAPSPFLVELVATAVVAPL